MVYRIDIQHFLNHAIDHFTRDDLGVNFQYIIISAHIKHEHTAPNVGKYPEFYPEVETITNYAEYHDKKIMEKMYMETLEPPKDCKNRDDHHSYVVAYNTFINPLLHHQDLVIICDKEENDYIDVFCKWLKKNFHIDVIDLNHLFIHGYVGPITIDRDKIKDRAVDLRISAASKKREDLESTRDGRASILGMMNKKEKIKKLNELGIKAKNESEKVLTEMLMEEWVNNGGEEN